MLVNRNFESYNLSMVDPEKHKLIKKDFEESLEEESESCQACGGTLKPEKVNLEEFEDGKLYLMENIVAYICEECGEMWIPEPILNEFENMMKTAKKYHKLHHPEGKKLKFRKGGSRVKRHGK